MARKFGSKDKKKRVKSNRWVSPQAQLYRSVSRNVGLGASAGSLIGLGTILAGKKINISKLKNSGDFLEAYKTLGKYSGTGAVVGGALGAGLGVKSFKKDQEKFNAKKGYEAPDWYTKSSFKKSKNDLIEFARKLGSRDKKKRKSGLRKSLLTGGVTLAGALTGGLVAHHYGKKLLDPVAEDLRDIITDSPHLAQLHATNEAAAAGRMRQSISDVRDFYENALYHETNKAAKRGNAPSQAIGLLKGTADQPFVHQVQESHLSPHEAALQKTKEYAYKLGQTIGAKERKDLKNTDDLVNTLVNDPIKTYRNYGAFYGGVLGGSVAAGGLTAARKANYRKNNPNKDIVTGKTKQKK